jgi:predicted transcriptional regulator of viral defense system
MSDRTQREHLLRLARRRGVVTTREARAAGVHHQIPRRMVDEGVPERIDRGRYRLRGGEVTEHHGLVAAGTSHRSVRLVPADHGRQPGDSPSR